MDNQESERLLDTIGGVEAELDKLRRCLEAESQFSSVLEQKLAAATARNGAACTEADALEASVRIADIQLLRQERGAELARRSAEMASEHAGQLADRLELHRTAAEVEQRRLGERVARLEVAVNRRVAEMTAAAAAAAAADGGSESGEVDGRCRPDLDEFFVTGMVLHMGKIV